MKVAIFSPYATVVPHFETELEIAQLHLDQGHRVEYVSCHGDLPNCDFNRTREESRCVSCLGRRQAGLALLQPPIRSRPVVPTSRTCLKPESFSSLQQLKDFKLDNFDIGYAALSSLISFLRDPEPDLQQNQELLTKFIESAIHMYFFTLDYIESVAPDRVYAFNGRFAAMRAVLRACQKSETDCWLHERGCDNDHFALYENHLPHEIEPTENWIRKLWVEAESNEREKIGASWFLDRANRVESNWHSFVRDQEQGLLPENWNPSRKNVSIFNSSDDEFVAIGNCWQNDLYPNQVEAIRKIVWDLQQRQPETHVYLRVHPNLTNIKNQRTKELLSFASPNLTTILPNAAIDSYQLLKASDSVVTFGSSIGIEAVFWERPSLSLGPCFYMNLGGTYRSKSHSQTMDLLSADLQPLPKTGALMYGFWCQTRGQKYRYFNASGLFDGSFKGKTIYAGMESNGRKSIAQKFKRESSRVLKQLTRTYRSPNYRS